MNESARLTVLSSISECDSHKRRLESAIQYMNSQQPLSANTFSLLSEEHILHLDQLIYRFIKMQDSIGTRLIPASYTIFEGDDRPRPFLDVLVKLEKIGIIESAETWQFFRNLRNNLSHDYPENLDQTVTNINLLLENLDKLFSLYKGIRDSVQSRIDH